MLVQIPILLRASYAVSSADTALSCYARGAEAPLFGNLGAAVPGNDIGCAASISSGSATAHVGWTMRTWRYQPLLPYAVSTPCPVLFYA
eukprot:2942093-Rhodomonas_salina.3